MRGDIDIVDTNRPIVVGSGIGGLTTALGLGGCTVITAAAVGSGSSELAQGGVAAAIGPDDDPSSHAADTSAVGGGIVDIDVADLVTASAAAQVDWFVGLGAEFDDDQTGKVTLGREAGHSHRRIVHAGGDATGAELMRVLRLATVMRDDIELRPRTRLIDLVRCDGRIVGVVTASDDEVLTAHLGTAVVLATGGIGGIYARSTNPSEVAGTGIAAAARHGATLADLEFVQFHPTAFALKDHPAPLVTEALRGEGATLMTAEGRQVMVGVHPDGDLAPRDVVARAVWTEIERGHPVFLDATAIGKAFPERFPTVFSIASDFGLDPRSQWIPVAPAEHFHMGGIDTDASGRTSLPGLWAVGEVASTGLHGANRLASNSLLEATVMGQRAATAIHDLTPTPTSGPLEVPVGGHDRAASGSPSDTVRSIAWSQIGIVRTGSGLEDAIGHLKGMESTDDAYVARLIAEAALTRTESRGSHYRADHPEPDDSFAHRSTVTPERWATVPIGALMATA